MSLDLGLEILGAALTILVILYIFVGNTFLFRIVSYSFVGVAAGYIFVLVIFQVLWPRISAAISTGDFGLLAVLLLFGIPIFFKLFPRLSSFGNISMAVLVGVGAAVVIGGAVFGTISGQLNGTFSLFSAKQTDFSGSRLAEGLLVLTGTVCTLAYFQFSVANRRNQPLQRSQIVDIMGTIGQGFIGIILGATFAGVFAAAMSALIERIGSIINVIYAIVH
jgi:hypothetical protein